MKQLPKYLTIIFLTFSLISATTTQWKEHKKDNYSIQFPDEWRLDKSGLMGAKFILFSPLDGENDNFSENVNLLIQDLTGKDIDLETFTDITEKQIKEFFKDGKLLESTRVKKSGHPAQKIIYYGKQQGMTLKWMQYFWVLNEKAYVLTFTSKKETYGQYIEEVEQIMDSFKVK